MYFTLIDQIRSESRIGMVIMLSLPSTESLGAMSLDQTVFSGFFMCEKAS